MVGGGIASLAAEGLSSPGFLRARRKDLHIRTAPRLGESTRDVLNLVHELEASGAHLRVLKPDISTASAMGKMVLTVLGMVSEMELGFVRKRQQAGIEVAKAKGVYKGRPVTLNHPRILAMRAEGKGASEIAKSLGCSRGAINKVLNARAAAGTSGLSRPECPSVTAYRLAASRP